MYENEETQQETEKHMTEPKAYDRGERIRMTARADEMIEELSRMESTTDDFEERVQRLLFGIEDELGISTIFWYKLIEDVGGMADYAERVGNRLRLLTAN